uniref:Uncharacterized protein n=1 Tax=Timema poppense TaxID=170557 RepID=A0A7R9GVM1_TIMPO|nr:unnamed protein product [Timema poppensis]
MVHILLLEAKELATLVVFDLIARVSLMGAEAKSNNGTKLSRLRALLPVQCFAFPIFAASAALDRSFVIVLLISPYSRHLNILVNACKSVNSTSQSPARDTIHMVTDLLAVMPTTKAVFDWPPGLYTLCYGGEKDGRLSYCPGCQKSLLRHCMLMQQSMRVTSHDNV